MSNKKNKAGFGTRAVHAGQVPDPSTGAIMTPIFQTSTYVQSGPNEHQGYDYSRAGNPTRTALEGNLAALESADHAVVFSSGVAATEAIVKCLSAGDHVIASNDLYGGTYRLFTQIFARFGLTFTFLDMTDLSAVDAAFRPETKLLWVETPTNPLLRVSDIEALCKLAKKNNAITAVDNTFASPYLQQPLALGADLVMHSATKYIGGHSDVIGGVVCTNDSKWNEDLLFQAKSGGAVPGPMDCFLMLRGTKTLHVRMERHCSNARAIAKYLDDHPKVGRVHYPGLPNDPSHEIAKKQMYDFGGMVSFSLANDDMEKAKAFLTNTHYFALAESLGGVESLVNHPASMTHASIPPEVRHAAGLSDSLIRLSVGIEDIDDLIADLDHALNMV